MGAVSARADEATVTMAQIDISFYAVTGAVVQEVLERLGHRVTLESTQWRKWIGW